MVLTENREELIESEAEVEALVDPGVWNMEVPGLAKYIQLRPRQDYPCKKAVPLKIIGRGENC